MRGIEREREKETRTVSDRDLSCVFVSARRRLL